MINFHKLRRDPAHHLGLGDIRITIGQQQEIEQEVTDLLAALERIATASEFHAQQGVADHVMRYAHESTFRLASAAILKARPQATSSYLNRPLRTFEQAVRDSEGKS